MKRALLAFATLIGLSSMGFAGTSIVLNGKQYGTGYLGRLPKDSPRTYFAFGPELMADLPDNYDTSEETSCIPAIRNQGSCGSCWDFATTGAFETALCLSGKAPVDDINLSEQDQLVNNKSAYGCQGGFMDGDFLQQSGETTEDLCPYKASDRYSCNGKKYAKATKWALLGADRRPTVDELRAGIVTYGALFVTVASSGLSPDSSGVVSGRSCNGTGIDHMVQIVGYRKIANGHYQFKMKNSWGTSWGLNGYAWLEQGCTQLASDPGDAAGFFYVEHEQPVPPPTPTPPPGPQPTPQPTPDPTPSPVQPVPANGVPYSVVAPKGQEVVLAVVPVVGMKYQWTIGTVVTAGKTIKVSSSNPSVDVVLQIKDRQRSVTMYTIKVDFK